ncbi:MAG: hypothetical protein EOP18_08870, partial [Rhizobiaceae bacterium]
MRTNLVSLYILQAIGVVAPVLIIPHLTRALGAETYGTLAFFQSVIAYGVVFLDYGFYVSAVRDVARTRHDDAALSHVVRRVFATKCVILVGVFAGLAIAGLSIPVLRTDGALLAFCSVQLVGACGLATWLFQGLETSRRLLLPQILARSFVTVAALVLVREPSDLYWAALLVSASDLICAILVWTTVRRSIDNRTRSLNWADIRSTLVGDRSLFVISVGSNLSTIFNPVLIGIATGAREVAFYSVSLRIAIMGSKVIAPAIQAVMPRIARIVVEDLSAARRLLWRSALVLCSLAGVVGLATFVFAPQIVRVVGGAEFAEASSVLRALAPLPMLLVLSALVGQNFATYIGCGASLARIYWAVGLANFCLLIPMISLFGPVGAAFTVTVSEFLVVVSILVIVR